MALALTNMTKSTNGNNTATLASMTTTLGFMQSQMAEIRADVKTLGNVFATKEELTNVVKASEDRFKRLEDSSDLWKWLSPTLSAIFASVITFFVIAYFTHH